MYQYYLIRLEHSRAHNQNMKYSAKDSLLCTGEIALVNEMFGNKDLGGIPIEYAKSIFENQQIPKDFKKAPNTTTFFNVMYGSVKLWLREWLTPFNIVIILLIVVGLFWFLRK